MPPTHRLDIRFTSSKTSLMIDPNTGLPSSENYGIDCQYNLIEVATRQVGDDRDDVLARVL